MKVFKKFGAIFGLFLMPIAWTFFFSIGVEWLNGLEKPMIGIPCFVVSFVLLVSFFWILIKWTK